MSLGLNCFCNYAHFDYDKKIIIIIGLTSVHNCKKDESITCKSNNYTIYYIKVTTFSCLNNTLRIFVSIS